MRALFFGAAAMLAACTFPDVQFSDASVLKETGSDVIVPNEGGFDVGADGPDPCDKDHDGHKDKSCGGDDCNDNDSRVHPGQDWIYDVPDAAPWGDWNCDGDAEARYQPAACGATTCNSAGYANNSATGCGISNPWVTCTGNGLLCSPVDAGTQTQGCR